MIIHLTKEMNFDEEIKEDIVLVDFFATWCGPCNMLTPEIEKLDKEAQLKIIKIDVDELPDIARKYKVMSIPTLLLFKDGKLINQSLGYMPLNHLKEFISKNSTLK